VTIDVARRRPATVVTLRGDLDLAAADGLRRAITGLVDEGRAHLVIDLGDVAYVDSSGLGAIVAAMKHARAAGGDIKLAALQEDVRLIFDMTRLIKVIETYPSLEEAIAAWA
jgi:anti-sigma B factor antagonist